MCYSGRSVSVQQEHVNSIIGIINKYVLFYVCLFFPERNQNEIQVRRLGLRKALLDKGDAPFPLVFSLRENILLRKRMRLARRAKLHDQILLVQNVTYIFFMTKSQNLRIVTK